MKKKVLVIDDEAPMRVAIVTILEVTGYEALQASDGQEGLHLARTELPDLILCDVRMPKLDGYELILELRKSAEAANIPFVFLSGESLPTDVRKGMTLGAEDYLTKPFSAGELLRVVELRIAKHEKLQKQMEERMEQLRKSISLSLPHEFRTPLTSVLGYAEILTASQGLSQDEVTYIGSHIHGSAKRLQRLLENMLLMSELEIQMAEPKSLERLRSSVTSIGFATGQIAESVAQQSGRKEDLRISVQDARARILESHFSKAVEELMSNAVKFSAKGTPIHVVASLEDGQALLVVQDSGRGMTEEEVQRIGAYVQFGRDQHEQQGSGLGLSLVRKIAQLYGGSLSVESSPSSGTKVSLRFPLAE